MRPSKPGSQTYERRALRRPPCELAQRRRSCEARAWVSGAAGRAPIAMLPCRWQEAGAGAQRQAGPVE